MTIVSFLARRRRVLALCAATAALHFVTIDWLGSRLGPQQSTAVKPAPSVMQAQLRLALPPRTASAAPPPEIKPVDPAAATPSPKPAAPRRTLRPAPLPQQSAVAEPAAQESGALTDPLAGIEQTLAAPPELAQPGATPAPAAVQSPPDAAAAAAAAATAAPASAAK